jgi:hypothetical protein
VNPFTPIAYLDLWALSSSLRHRLALFEGEAPLFVRSNAEGGRDGAEWLPIMQEWPQLRNAITRIRRLPGAENYEWGAIWIQRLMPQQSGMWVAAEAGEWGEGVVAIVANPSTCAFCGTATIPLTPWHLVAVNRALPRCVVNWGEQPAFVLHVEFRKVEAEYAVV